MYSKIIMGLIFATLFLGSFSAPLAYAGASSPGSDTTWESYVTSIGEIRDFYDASFGAGNTINEIVLFLDIVEEDDLLDFDEIEIITDYASPSGGDYDNPNGNDEST